MLLASFSRLALIGATMFSLIGADPNGSSSSDISLVEKKDSYDKSHQVYKDDPIHRIAAELSRADSRNAKSYSPFATAAAGHHHSGQQSSRSPLAGGAPFRRPRPHRRPRPTRPRRSVLDEGYFSGPRRPQSQSPSILWSSSSWKQRRKPATTAEKRSYSSNQYQSSVSSSPSLSSSSSLPSSSSSSQSASSYSIQLPPSPFDPSPPSSSQQKEQEGQDEEAPPEVSEALGSLRDGLAQNLLVRRPRAGLRYDVPQIECPRTNDRMQRFACPTPDFRGRYRCIDDRALCNGFFDCPGREDEKPDQCLFFKTTKAHLDILAEALLRWGRGKK